MYWSVREFPNFNPQDDAEILHKAMKGFGKRKLFYGAVRTKTMTVMLRVEHIGTDVYCVSSLSGLYGLIGSIFLAIIRIYLPIC